MHIKAAREKPLVYPKRAFVPLNQIEWSSDFDQYSPVNYTSEIVLKQYNQHKENGWAHPDNPLLVVNQIQSYIQELNFDALSRPINPMGRTGICGRGLLGKWGANFAEDALLMRTNPTTEKVELLLIQRQDNMQWALPGGMVDSNEPAVVAASRELKEETGIEVTFNNADIIYQGYVDDPRNTDNAWMETTVACQRLPYHETLQMPLEAADDAIDVQWKEVSQELLEALYASHRLFVELAIKP